MTNILAPVHTADSCLSPRIVHVKEEGRSDLQPAQGCTTSTRYHRCLLAASRAVVMSWSM